MGKKKKNNPKASAAIYLDGYDAAAVMGCNPKRKPLDVYLGKKRQAEENVFFPLLEEAIVRGVSMETGLQTRRFSAQKRHPELDFLVVNPGRVILSAEKGTGLLEIETDGRGLPAEKDVLPMDIFTRIQHDLAVTGYGYALLSVLLNDYSLSVTEVKRDDLFIGRLLEKLAEFHRNHIAKGSPPVETKAEGGLPGNAVEAEIEIVETCRLLISLKSQLKMLRKEEKDAEAIIKSFIGEHEQLHYNGEALADWKPVKRQIFDNTAFREEYPELYDMFLKDSDYRKFEIKAEKVLAFCS